MGWEQDLDRWLTTPPEPVEPQVLAECPMCNEELVECQDDVYFHEATEKYFCSVICLRDYIKENLTEELDDIIEALQETGRVNLTNMPEAEEPEPPYED